MDAATESVSWIPRELILHVTLGLYDLAQQQAEREGCPASVKPTYRPSNKYRNATECTWRWHEVLDNEVRWTG